MYRVYFGHGNTLVRMATDGYYGPDPAQLEQLVRDTCEVKKHRFYIGGPFPDGHPPTVTHVRDPRVRPVMPVDDDKPAERRAS